MRQMFIAVLRELKAILIANICDSEEPLTILKAGYMPIMGTPTFESLDLDESLIGELCNYIYIVQQLFITDCFKVCEEKE